MVAAGRRQGVPTLAITNDPSSALAAAAEFIVDLAAGPERAVAATKTYTTSLLAIARLSAAMSESGGESAGVAALAAVPQALEAAPAPPPPARAIGTRMGAFGRVPGAPPRRPDAPPRGGGAESKRSPSG